MKKLLSTFVIFLVLISLAGCGCEHQWEDATCDTPKTCLICGKTQGEPLGHEWVGPTCVDPEFCSVCGIEKPSGAEALGHDYQNGYCTICGAEDPDFVDLDNFGFINNYGMNEWIEITGYNSEHVKIYSSSSEGVYRFFGNYECYAGSINYCEAKMGIQDMKNSSWDTNTIKTLSNDTMQDTMTSCVTIMERVIINENAVVLKGVRNNHDEWYVPTEMLDWSTCIKTGGKTDAYGKLYGYEYHVNFKK